MFNNVCIGFMKNPSGDSDRSIENDVFSSARDISAATHIYDHCPDCGVKMVRLGSCFSCPRCGYGSCG